MYIWIKAAHIASLLIFVSGLATLYLTNMIINNPTYQQSSMAARVRNVTHRWDKAVTRPALLLVWIFGLWMALESGAISEVWMQIKLVFALVVSGFHGMLAGRLRRNNIAKGRENYPAAAVIGGLILSFSVIAVMAVTKLNIG